MPDVHFDLVALIDILGLVQAVLLGLILIAGREEVDAYGLVTEWE